MWFNWDEPSHTVPAKLRNHTNRSVSVYLRWKEASTDWSYRGNIQYEMPNMVKSSQWQLELEVLAAGGYRTR